MTTRKQHDIDERRGSADDAAHGREADHPTQIPSRGWRDVAWRVKDEVSNDNVGLVAAGVAFYSILAIFPGIAALVAIYALVADPATIEAQLGAVPGIPQEARSIVVGELHRLNAKPTALGFGFAFSLLLALWSASKAASALMSALNIVYDEKEERGFLKLLAVAMAFTLGSLLVGALAIGAVAVVPAWIGAIGLGPVGEWAGRIVPFAVVAATFVALLAALYRWGPARAPARWRWVTPGSSIATLLWIVASAVFSIYVSNFAGYDETYGSLGAVVVLLMWLWLSAYVVLLGAELNAELEHQTRRDTTTPPHQPMGEREAYVADTVGPPR